MKKIIMKKSNAILRLLAISALIAVVAVSGCITGDSSKASTSFGQDALLVTLDTEGRDTFDDNEDFTITISAENLGEFQAKDVQVKLLGYDGIAKQPAETKQMSTTGNISPKNLDAPDENRGVTGGVGYVDWSVTAPDLSTGTPDREVSLTADVYYDYNSLASQRVVVVHRDYLSRIGSEGGDVPTSSEVTAVNGPISVNIESPLPHVKLSGNNTTFFIKVVLTNDGSGSVSGDSGADYLDEVTLAVPAGLTIVKDSCDFNISAADATNKSADKTAVITTTSTNKEKLRLTQGGLTRTLNCKLVAYKDKAGDFNTYSFNTEASYRYIQEVTKPLLIENVE